MKTSEQIGEIAAALAKAQGQIQAAKADSENPHYKSKYADLASVWDACRVPLSTNALSIAQVVERDDVKLNIVTRLMHSSGQWIESTLPLILQRQDMQSLGASITYGRRFGLAAMCGIAQEDDDGNSISNLPQRFQKDSKFAATPAHSKALQGGQAVTSVSQARGQGEADSPTVLPGPIGTRSASPDLPQNTDPTDEEIERFQAHCKKHGWKNSQVVDLIRARYKKATPRTCSIKQLDEIAEIIRVRTPAQALNIPVKTDFPRELDHKPLELSDASEPPGDYDPSFDFGLDLAQENEKRK